MDKDDSGNGSSTDISLEYSPSLVDRLTQAVEDLPAPAWVRYALIGVLLAGIFVAIQAWQGAYEQWGFFGGHVFIALQPLFPLAATHYLDRVAGDAIRRFRPAMKGDASEFLAARLRMTTMPARGAMIAGAAGVVASVGLFIVFQDPAATYELARLAPGTLSVGTFLFYILLAWFGFGVWVYHTIHQLRTIHSLYTDEARVDPFHPEPLYALSSVTSRTAIVILANTYGWFAVNAASGASTARSFAALVVTNVFFVGLGLLIFVWPLWGPTAYWRPPSARRWRRMRPISNRRWRSCTAKWTRGRWRGWMGGKRRFPPCTWSVLSCNGCRPGLGLPVPCAI